MIVVVATTVVVAIADDVVDIVAMGIDGIVDMVVAKPIVCELLLLMVLLLLLLDAAVRVIERIQFFCCSSFPILFIFWVP